ncbi:hypothetical protein EV421DRAFT_1449812 [Armillaria borealis]|uniref:Uncharacterized protein n=1 Tax=Armillaria borealis TaxID=47425 RepID=A0AA39J1D8_9AGAR|nr:hypothetical protein EV421DRAFT_1449812 [Armillaria borealis]
MDQIMTLAVMLYVLCRQLHLLTGSVGLGYTLLNGRDRKKYSCLSLFYGMSAALSSSACHIYSRRYPVTLQVVASAE